MATLKGFKFIAASLAIVAVFTVFFTFTLFRAGFEHAPNVELEITGLAQKGPLSEGVEVDIWSMEVNGRKPYGAFGGADRQDGEWFDNGWWMIASRPGGVFAGGEEEASITLSLEAVEKLVIQFVRQPNGGRVRVTLDGKSDVLDLYAEETQALNWAYTPRQAWGFARNGWTPLLAVFLFTLCGYGVCLALVFRRRVWAFLQAWLARSVASRVAAVAAALLCLNLLFFSVVSVTPMLPQGARRENLVTASEFLREEGRYPVMVGNPRWLVVDNFSTASMLDMLYSIDHTDPIRSAMRGEHFTKGENENPVETFYNLTHGLHSEEELAAPLAQSTRYWHGYMFLYSVLLSLFDLNFVRYLLALASMVLFGLCCALLHRKHGWPVSVAFCLAFAAFKFPLFSLELLQSQVFLLALAGLLLLLRYEPPLYAKVFLFLALGAFTAFVDLLTAPLVVCLIPLVYEILNDMQNGDMAVPRYARFGLFWCLGYAFSWAFKWAIASVALGTNEFRVALATVLYRASDAGANWLNEAEGGGLAFRLFALKLNVGSVISLYNPHIWLLVAVLALFAGAAAVLVVKRAIEPRALLFVVLVAAVPHIWFLLTANHARIHFWMTYRNQLPTLWLLFSFILLVVGYGMGSIGTSQTERDRR